MTVARSEMVTQGEEACYHCISRCVRGAYLGGVDPYTGQSQDHRKGWVQARLQELAALFGIEVITYAVMSNHLHVMLRTRPDLVEGWSAEDTVRRWLTLAPKDHAEDGRPKAPSRTAIKALAGKPKRLDEIRSRLGSVSWFMRSLNEFLSRTANREDGCKGRFWEGRFKCQVLLDDAALLACMAFVDLNPVRSGLADTPEQSEYTGLYDRIQDRASGPDATWLCPIGVEESGGLRGVLPLNLDEYLSLMDWTGREIRLGTRGEIPAELSDILGRLPINQARWLDTVKDYGKLFHQVVGHPDAMKPATEILGKRWLRGVRAGKEAFTAD
ncbi:MAG: hypothetical protein KKB20_20030 [Proteobacteria bacterium]|nr:hypothetical protein [Pseudomonadota bacterium]